MANWEADAAQVRRLDVLVVQGLDTRYDVDAPGSKMYTLPQLWRDAAIEILSKPVEKHSHFASRPDVVSGEIEEIELRNVNMKSKPSNKIDDKKTDDLDDMREAFKKHKERQTGSGNGKSDYDKLETGKNVRYFLPVLGQRKFYTEGWTHFNVGPNNRAIRCIDEAHIDPEKGFPMSGTTCPNCKRFLREQARINSEYKKGDKDGQEEWKRAKDKYVPRHQYYSNVLREDDDGDFEVKLLPYGPQIWAQLMNYYLGDDTDVGDFTHPKSGKWLNVKKESKGRDRRNIEYKVYPVDGPSISKGWGSIKEALLDLDAAPGKVISVEEFTAIVKGIDVDKDSSDDRAERRRSRDEDEDDDGDRDEDEDDDRPVSKKKSQLAKRRDRDD